MKEQITLYADEGNIFPAATPGVLEVTLTGVDICQLIEEVGRDNLLEEMDCGSVKAFIEEKEAREREEEGIDEDKE